MKLKLSLRKKTGKKRLGYGKSLLKRRSIRRPKVRRRGLLRRKRTPKPLRRRRFLRPKQRVHPRDFTVPVETSTVPAQAPVIDSQAVGVAPGTMLPHDATAFNKGYEDAYQEGFDQGFAKGYEEGSSLSNQA
ncbi:hypothetical protein ACE41H_10510 [Paenibacillus enshidis]|uniref:Uncharacterized protein n=1 Tax=Paenibacillus enshidis TaxID=1458439 RepID=A0ABV5ATN2_9BACL